MPRERDLLDKIVEEIVGVQDFVKDLLNTETLEEYLEKVQKHIGKTITAFEAKLLAAHKFALVSTECIRDYAPDMRKVAKCIAERKEVLK